MKILYICTHNRCRSILAEAITRHLSGRRIEARSAGSQPAGKVHPLTLKNLREHDIPTDNLKSQSWDAFEQWQPDIVVTVCDSAAGEQCPVWFGNSLKVHWPLADPSANTSDEAQASLAFAQTIDTISKRIIALLALDIKNLDDTQLKTALESLGETHGSV